MKTEILSQGAFGHMRVLLEPGESFVSEAGKMVRMSPTIETDVTTRSRGGGGILAGLKRLVGGDSFFLSTYHAQGGPGEVVLAPFLLGEVAVVELDGSQSWLCAGGSYMASGPDVAVEPKWQGMKGFFTGESLFYLEASGTGPLVVNAFGNIRTLDVDGTLIIDTGHVVAFESGMTYEITKAGGSWLSSFFAGEGVVMKFSGRGRIMVQSHNPTEFGKALGPLLPPRSA